MVRSAFSPRSFSLPTFPLGSNQQQLFLPESEISRLITAESVGEYCSAYPESTNIIPGGTAAITSFVCGKRPARKVFAILVFLNEPTSTLLQDVIGDKIRDEHLPLQRSRSRDTDFELVPSSLHRRTFQRCRKWTFSQRQSFESLQWRMLSPVLAKFPLHRPETPDQDQELDPRLIMPWIEYEKLPSSLEDHKSEIIKVHVHPSHIGFTDLRDGSSDEPLHKQYFALKILKVKSKFLMEVRASQKINPQSHLAPALAWFSYQSQYYLVFRWAEGGNLSNFWETAPIDSIPKVDLFRWLAQQSLGLAIGLDSIHHTEMSNDEARGFLHVTEPLDLESDTDRTHMSSNTSDDQGERITTNDKNCGRHGDIKPPNILWYSQENNEYGLGVLKISDFGLTTFHSALTTSRPAHEIPITWTYAAPERYHDAQIADVVSRPFDIWSLGCVYLEFVTWVLLGNEALEDFAKVRKAEPGRMKGFELDNFFVALESQKGTRNPSFRKKEYVQVKKSVLKVTIP